MLFNFGIFAILYLRRNRVTFRGEQILSYIFLYGATRSIVEVFRGDPRGWWLGQSVTTSQLISIVAVAAGTILYFRIRDKNRIDPVGPVGIVPTRRAPEKSRAADAHKTVQKRQELIMTHGKKFTERLFPPYRLIEETPFGFWYVGFFGMVIAFFNISINFFSHLSILLGYLTGTLGLSGVPRQPGGLDLFLSGAFACYYLVSAPLFVWLSAAYWNFKPKAKKRLLILLSIDVFVFCLYNILFFTGIYLYRNHYLMPKLPLYAVLAAVAVYYLMGKSDEEARKVVDRAERRGA